MLKQNYQAGHKPNLRADNRYLTRLLLQNDGSFVGFSLFLLKKKNPSLNIKGHSSVLFLRIPHGQMDCPIKRN